MDLSLWRDLNSHVVIKETTKKFYDRYYNKVSYFIPGAYLIHKGHHYVHSTGVQYFNFKEKHVENLFNLTMIPDTGLKFRIEGSAVSVFHNDLAVIYEHNITTLEKFSPYAVNHADDINLREILDQKSIILQKPPKYQYRVAVRGGRYATILEKQSLARFIKNVGPEVRIGANFLQELDSGYKYLNTGHIYVNDLSLLDVITLICPKFIRSVHKLTIK